MRKTRKKDARWDIRPLLGMMIVVASIVCLVIAMSMVAILTRTILG